MNNELKRTKRRTQYLMLFLVIRSILGEVTDTNSFINKLKSCIELHEEHTKNAATKPFTVFRVVNHKMRIDDLISLYETFTNKKDVKDHLTVMTIAYDMSDELYNKKKFTKEFISAIQQIVDLKTNYVTQGNLSMNVKYIEREHMTEIVLSDITLTKIVKIYRRLNELIVDNFIPICQSVLKQFIVQEFKMRFCICLGSFQNGNANLEIDKMAIKIYTTFTRRLNYLQKVNFDSEAIKYFLLEASNVFDPVNQKLIEYEMSVDCLYFTDDIRASKVPYMSLFTGKYYSALDASLRHMLITFLQIVQNDQAGKMLLNIFNTTIREMLSDTEINPIYNNDSQLSTGEYVDICFGSETVRNRLEIFLELLSSEEFQSKIENNLQTNVDEVYQETQDAINVTIAFEFQLDEYNVYRICRILNDIEAFENHHQNQFVYIEDAINGTEKSIRIDSDSLNKLGLQSYSDTETINIGCITFAPLTHMVYSWTYNPATKPVLNNEISSVCDIASKQKTTIALDLCYMIENDEVMKGIITNRLKRSNSKMNVLYKIKIHNERDTFHVYVLNHAADDGLQLERNTLAYVLQSNNKEQDKLGCYQPTRQVKFVNAFKEIYDGLLFYIQYLQFVKGADIEIPNVCIFGSIDYTYSEKSSYIRLLYDPFNYSQDHLWLLFAKGHFNCKFTSISAKEIIEFCIKKKYKKDNSDVFEVLRQKGISSDTLNKMLCRFVLNKDVEYRPEEYPLAISKHKIDCSTILYLDSNSDNNVSLNICTLKAYNYFHQVSASVDKIIAKISESENDLAVYKAVDEVLKCKSANLTLKQLITKEFLRQSNFADVIDLDVTIGKEIKRIMETIVNSLDTLFLYKKTKTCQSSLENEPLSSQNFGMLNVQQMISPEYITRLEKQLIQDLKKRLQVHVYKSVNTELNVEA